MTIDTEVNINDYIAPTMPDEDKPCYLCKYLGEAPDFPSDTWCKFLKTEVNDWGTCKHFIERRIDDL